MRDPWLRAGEAPRAGAAGKDRSRMLGAGRGAVVFLRLPVRFVAGIGSRSCSPQRPGCSGP